MRVKPKPQRWRYPHGAIRLFSLVAGAEAVIDSVEQGEEESFPDPMSQMLADGWRAGVTKELERQNATLVQAVAA